MDLTLTEEQLGFQRLAREFLDEEVVPYRTEWDRRESVDPAIIPKLGELGFFGLTIPEEYGGLGGDYVTYCLGMEELGRADSAVRGIVSVSMGLFGKVVLDHGTEEQKQQWLPGIAAGTTLGCFGLTEPDSGSDAGNLRTRAVRDWRRLRDHRQQDVHHQRRLGRPVSRLRPHGRARRQGHLRVRRSDRRPA
jgi:alkylation response protein AidB-like acyl-CoA dehydrogenase